MSWLFVHATAQDIEVVRDWINDSPDVAWIIKVGQSGHTYNWQAVAEIASIAEQQYSIWHMASGPINIPSGSLDQPDMIVSDPFKGWTQALDQSGATVPWFGANLPGPFNFTFQEHGKEQPGSLGRSEFNWALDRYAAIGKPAHPDAKRWWQRLRRFLAKSSVKTPFPGPASRFSTFVFPDAMRQHQAGRHLDINP